MRRIEISDSALHEGDTIVKRRMAQKMGFLAEDVAALRGQVPRPFEFKIIGLLATMGRRTGVGEIFGVRFSAIIAWWLWRGIYLCKLPGLEKKVRVALDWILDVIFSKDIVQLPTLRSLTMSEAEEPSAGTAHER